MKKNLKYLLITIPFLFFFTSNVNAKAVDIYTDLKYPNDAGAYNCVSANNCWNYLGINETGTRDRYWFSNDVLTTKGGSGMVISIVSDTMLKKGNYYSVTFYLAHRNGVSLTTETNNSSIVSQGSSAYEVATYGADNISASMITGVDYYFDNIDYGIASNGVIVTAGFKALRDGNYVGLRVTTTSTTTGQVLLFGYQLQDLGSSVSTQDVIDSVNSISNDIKNSVTNAQNSINNNIQNMQNEVNNNINDLKDKQDQTNDTLTSEDSDVSSKKCGVVCKLKGIFTGIIELPGKIISGFIDGLKSLFVPKNMDFINNLVESLENKLGLIAQVPIRCIEFILNLANATWSEFKSVSLPSISFFGFQFWNAQEIDLSEGIKIFSTFRYITDVICVGICVRTLFKWYENFTGGGN